ncbi:glycosyltransferase family 2 protein [Cohnella abietis]|uniref:Glycosyltransferase 2-like domain-containing protein n=1 Tax=Cohnella abietis TaxID=2507935 RepID=A0A3T1DDH5_9BACL|nr:glycosyltransferase family 2 protein [Cohnella abietis]BBI36142.1 hypothetical protein KCTCHS21_55410 [Cohnella abietis]
MKISVCLIVRNEEKKLHRALQSIPKNYEIIVTDTGSTDSTVHIAKQFKAKTYEYIWNDDFASARNYCASWATGDYILVIDADEVLPTNTDDQIQQFIGQYPGAAGCVVINNIMSGEMKKHRMVRLYPKDPSYYFEGNVHEQVYKDNKPAVFEMLQLELLHDGYEEEDYKNKKKMDRYLPMYEAHLKENPDDGYMLYQMGKLYYSMSEWKMAEHYLGRAYIQKEYNHLHFPVVIVMLGYVLKEQNRVEEANDLLKPFEPVYLDFPDLFFLLGLLAMDSGHIEAVEGYFTQALAIGETEKYTTVYGVGTFKAAYNLGLYYEFTGNSDLSQQCYHFAAEYQFEPALVRLNKK